MYRLHKIARSCKILWPHVHERIDKPRLSSVMEYTLVAAPENASTLSPQEARALFRLNKYHGSTTGFCAGYLQTNVAVLPKSLANDFGDFCRKNHAALPLLYCSQPGEVTTSLATVETDIRSDLPRYCVYSKGRLVEDTLDLLGFAWDDCVTFYTGCSFSFESALLEASLEVRNLSEGKQVSIYQSNIMTHPVGDFSCPMTVTMRPFLEESLERVVDITAQFPDSHGAPIHIGDPSHIGVELNRLQSGEEVEVKSGEVPVFWACGVTNSNALASAKPQLAFTHFPGSMFITDQLASRKPLDSPPRVVRLSRKDAPFFASVLGETTYKLFSRLEQALLEDPGGRGVAHLFQESDLLRATLALSHSRRVAVTTGFPCLTQYEVKEETDGLPGALSICHALLCLGKEVVLVVDTSSATLFNLCADYMASIGGLKSKIPVLLLENAKEMMQNTSSDSRPAFDCLVAIERVGKNKNGKYLTMTGKDVSDYVDPIDGLFEEAMDHPLVTTIAIGDGGNELGMGKVGKAVQQHITKGAEIGCVVSSDCLIAAGVSNWAGQALAGGLYAVSSCPLHWRYRKHGINAETPPVLDINDFVNTERFSSLLYYMNSVGVRDGITGSLDQSVDGQPLSVHVDKMQQIIDIVTQK